MSNTLGMKEIEGEAKFHKYILFIHSSFSHHSIADLCTLLPSGGPHNEDIVVVRRDKHRFCLHCFGGGTAVRVLCDCDRILAMFGFSSSSPDVTYLFV